MATLQQLSDWFSGLQTQGLTNSQTGSHISYQDLVDTFNKQGVPQAAWLAELYAEGVGFNDAQHQTITPKEWSIGPFQYNVEGGLGTGKPITTLQDPKAESALAANDMGSMLKKVGLGPNSSLADVMHTLGYNWPGDPNGADALNRTSIAQGFQMLLSGGSAATPAPAPTSTPGSGSGLPANWDSMSLLEKIQWYNGHSIDPNFGKSFDPATGAWKNPSDAGFMGWLLAIIIGLILIVGGIAWLISQDSPVAQAIKAAKPITTPQAEA